MIMKIAYIVGNCSYYFSKKPLAIPTLLVWFVERIIKITKLLLQQRLSSFPLLNLCFIFVWLPPPPFSSSCCRNKNKAAVK